MYKGTFFVSDMIYIIYFFCIVAYTCRRYHLETYTK